MPGGYRHMYHVTGLPGWMRCGVSPGWGGMPPGATYLKSGQPGYPGFRPGRAYGYPGFQPYPVAMMTPEQELELLKNQAQFLNQQVEQIAARMKVLEEQGVS